MSKEATIDRVSSKPGERVGKPVRKPTPRIVLGEISDLLKQKQAEGYCRHYPPIEEPWVGFSKF